RELALRRTAEQVDAEMKAYMRDHAVPRTWPVSERILVCVSPSPLSAQLVRAGRRLAARIDAQWIVAYVETPASVRLPQEARDRVVQTLRLAEQLGAETVTLSGATMSDEILACARDRNVSQIVIGKPGRSLWRRIVLGSVVDALVRGSGEIDIYVVSGDREIEPMKAPRIRPQPLDGREYALALGTVGVCTGLAWLMFRHVGLSNLVMVYLLGVVVVATRAGRVPTALASVLSVAVFDFFFVPPYLSFAVADTEHLITFTVMLIVALVISGLTMRIRAQADRARDRERRIAALYALSRDLATTRDVEGLLETAVKHIADVFPGELAVAHWVYQHGQLAGLGTATLPGARAVYLPLVGSRGAIGVLGLSPTDAHALESPEQLHQLETFANQMALAIERARASEDARRAEVRAEAERLRNSLLSSVSHDLRTPLASITGAASSLI